MLQQIAILVEDVFAISLCCVYNREVVEKWDIYKVWGGRPYHPKVKLNLFSLIQIHTKIVILLQHMIIEKLLREDTFTKQEK